MDTPSDHNFISFAKGAFLHRAGTVPVIRVTILEGDYPGSNSETTMGMGQPLVTFLSCATVLWYGVFCGR